MVRGDEDEFFATWIHEALEDFTSRNRQSRENGSIRSYIRSRCREKYGNDWKCKMSNRMIKNEKKLKSCFRFELDNHEFLYIYRT